MKAKIYKIELMIIDTEEVEDVASEIENARYANRCITPHVMSVKVMDGGEWGDDHPLNHKSTQMAEYRKLFPND